MSFGERITELRKTAGLSQLELAKIMDVSRQAVSKWETGQSSPDAMNLIQLAEVLDTDIEYLTTGRRNFGRRPPVVIKTTETVEKVIEKPVVQVVETVIEKPIEIPVVQTVEKPVIKKVYRTRYIRSKTEIIAAGILCFLLGFVLGRLL